ncbi:MAG: hypothetical protein ACFE75_07385 [Candidatus Hodarchaeota archaeon]
MAKKTRQKLINDGIRKERGICHQFKTHKKFSKRQGRLRSICEECRKDLYLIKNLKKKLNLNFVFKLSFNIALKAFH